MTKTKEMTKDRYSELLDEIQEHLPYAVQKLDKESGEWRTVGNCVRGRDAAYDELTALKKMSKKSSFRVLPKNEADKYREGITLGRKLGPEKEKPRLPSNMFMPEHM